MQWIAVGDAVDDQVAENQPGEYRQLPQGIRHGAQALVVNEQDR